MLLETEFEGETLFPFINNHIPTMISLSNPIPVTVLALTICLFTVQFIKLIRNKKDHNNNKKYHPIGGTIFHQLYNFDKLHHYMTDLAGKYKTYRLISPLRNEIYTSDPANVEYILKTNFDNYGKGLYSYEILKDLLGTGIFAVDGDKWRQQRKISSHEFSTKMLRDFSTSIFQKNAAKLANIVSQSTVSNQAIDILDLLMKSSLDSIFQVAFGSTLDTMCGSSEESKTFNTAFDSSSAIILFRYVDIFWKIKKFLNIGSEATLKKNIEIVDKFVYKLINTKIDQMKKPNCNREKREDILSRFLQVAGADPVYLRDIMLNFVIAGKDTTATTLGWFIYLLCKHPHVQEKVAQEVKQVIKMRDHVASFSDFLEKLSEDDLEKMQYLHAAITETLRLYPAVPVDAKICFSDDTLPDGFSVKKGDMVSYQPYAMGRMKFIWGDDVEEFKPERWLNENGDFQPESPFRFTAFQAGPRICLGREFAYRQMKILSAVLVRYFRFEMSDETKIVRYKTMINLHIDGALEVRAFQRSWE